SANVVKLGAPLSQKEIVPLAAIAKQPDKYAKTSVRTEGKITAVCQAMGCWMQISDANGEAHVKMSGHSFLIPRDAAGRRAVVEVTLIVANNQGECEKEAEEATGKTVKLELVATGVELL